MTLITSISDIGISKKVNQDAILIKKAKVVNDEIIFAAVCDGMGGLANGEIASSHLVDSLDKWFEESLPEIMKSGISNNKIKKSLTKIILDANERIAIFGDKEGMCGTTVSGILLYLGHYAIINIGDSRTYRIREDEGIQQLSHDHSVVQGLIDRGKITKEEAAHHPQRNMLTQCVGASGKVSPDYFFGTYKNEDLFLICSDGFRHKLKEGEMSVLLSPSNQTNEEILNTNVSRAIDVNKKRLEKDNISAIAIKIEEV